MEYSLYFERRATQLSAFRARDMGYYFRLAGLGLAALIGALTVSASQTVGASDGQPQKVTLKRAFRLALKNNPIFPLLDARVAAAAADKRRAWAAILPTLGVSARYTRNEKEVALDYSAFVPPGTPAPPSTVMQKKDAFSLGGRLALPLFVPSAYVNIGIARQALRAKRLSQVRSRRDFLLQVASAYYAVLFHKDALRAEKHKRELDQRSFETADARVKAGQTPRSDRLQARVALIRSAQQLNQRRALLVSARRQLGILIGAKDMVDAQATQSRSGFAASATALTRSALAVRKDVEAARVNVNIAQRRRRSVKWSFAPTVEAEALYRWQNSEGFLGKRGSWQAGVTLTLPLYDGGLRYAALRKTAAAISARRQQYRLLLQGIEREIVQLHAELRAAESAVAATQKMVGSTKTIAIDIAERYKAGAATQLEVLSANHSLFQVEIALARSQSARDLLRLRLAHATGRLGV